MASLNWFSYSFFTFSPLLYSPTVYCGTATNNYKYSALVCYSIDLASAIRGDTWLERKKGVLCFQYCQIFHLVQKKFFCFWPKRYARYNQNQIDREKRKNCNYFKPFTTGISQQEKQRSIWTDFQSNLGTFNRIFNFRKKSLCCLLVVYDLEIFNLGVRAKLAIILDAKATMRMTIMIVDDNSQ